MYRLAETLDTDALITAASSLSERINGGQTETAQEPVNAEQNNQLFQTWLANTAQGDWKGFDQRLAWDGLDRDMAHRLVAWSRPTLGQTPF